MEKTLISKCCRDRAICDEFNCTCLKCKEECEAEEVCAECLGTGEVTTMEYVYAGEPHQAPIGTRKCICQTKEYEREQ